MKVSLYIGDNLLDLYEDENIELNASVVDIENIENNTTEFTKDFTVPASNKNNRTFKHYYNADIDNGFDARVKVNGKILINGFVFKLGKYRLSKVAMKNGKPSSYTIQFWGNLLNLKDILGDAYLSDLPLSYYDHFYNSTIVKEGLTSSLVDTHLVYTPFVKRQYYYNSIISDRTNTDTLTNIAYNDADGSNGIRWNDLRPSIRLIQIIVAIELYTGIKFSRDFFDRTEFYNLFLWLNSDSDEDPGGDTQTINWDSGSSAYMNLSTDIGSYTTSNTPAINDNLTWNLYVKIIPSVGYENVAYTVNFYKDGELSSESEGVGTKTMPGYSLDVSDAEENPHTYNCYWEVSTSQDFKYTAELHQHKKIASVTTIYKTYASQNNIVSFFTMSEEMPKIKVIDFLKGIFKMFKLVVIPTDYDKFYVNTLVDFYASGNNYDITNYVDLSSYEVSRGDILNEINFTFEEPTTILNLKYEENNDRAYGDEENYIKDENGVLLDGDSLDYQVPFEQFIYERLIDTNTNEAVNFQYGLILDESLDAVNPSAHIFYNVNTSLDTTNISFINGLGEKELLNSTLNIPSHTMTLENSKYSTVFHEELSEWNYSKITNTLYVNYHKDYIDSIFNPKRRDYTFNAKLPFKILNKLQLNDILKIKENYYRINDYNLNLITGVVELNLISSFDKITTVFKATSTNVLVDYKAQTQSVYVTNLGSSTFTKIYSGFGTDWVSISTSLNSIYFTFAYNSEGVTREMYVDVTNSDFNKTIRFYLNQSEGGLTVDSNTITVDNNIITVDNG